MFVFNVVEMVTIKEMSPQYSYAYVSFIISAPYRTINFIFNLSDQ